LEIHACSAYQFIIDSLSMCPATIAIHDYLWNDVTGLYVSSRTHQPENGILANGEESI
jgi:hypothetical protein